MAKDYRINIDTVKTGQNMTRIRKSKGLSTYEVAKAIGFSAPQTIYKWERGECLPRVDHLFSLCQLYQVSPTDLCCFINDNNSNKFRLVVANSNI